MEWIEGACTPERWQLMQERELRFQRGAILYDADFLRKCVLEPTPALFEPDHWRTVGALDSVPGGRARVAFIRREDGDWVLRHYRRGGLIGRVVHDLYVWTGAARTRCFREWRLLAQLHAWNLPVPQPIAARYERAGALYRADLLTLAIPHVTTLARLVIDGQADAACWAQLGTTLARFHARGVHHADLNAHNVLVDRDGKVFVLDFDRGRVSARGAWEEQVLSRLRRSLRKIKAQQVTAQFAEDDWSALIAAYREALTGC